jgi:hypothetical protein
MTDRAPRGRAALIALLWTATALNLVYWISFFTNGAVQSSQDPVYLGFEAAFPAADAWLGITSLLCAEGLRRRRPWGVLFGIAAGSAWVYLGLMDTLYSLEHNLYAQPSAEVFGEMAIEVACFTVGPFLMWYTWRHRHWLDPNGQR